MMKSDVSLGAMVRENAVRHGARLAYIDGDRSLTHSQLAARALQLASACYKAGCLHQDRVAIYSMNRIEFGEAYAACQISGLIAATVNFRLAPPEVLRTVVDSGAKVLIFEDNLTEVIAEVLPLLPADLTCVCIGNAPEWATEYEAFVATGDVAGPPFQGSGDDIAAILYTSGSTGRPKGCITGQREFAHLCQLVSAGMRMSEHDSTALPMPLFHLGAKVLQAATHWRGGTVVVIRHFDPADYLKTLQDLRVTKGHLAPTMIQMLLEVPNIAEFDLSAINMIMYSAAAMPVPVLRRAISIFGNVFANSYGMTEGPATILNPEQHLPDGTEREQAWLNSVGIPYPTVQAKIMLDEENEAPQGDTGEIWLRSNAMFRGYWNDSNSTIQTLRNGWYRSGDMGRIDADGFLYIVDRKKDVIISGGENIYSREVEDALLAHPDILEVAVIGQPDEKWGERVCAIVVTRTGSTLTDDDVIKQSTKMIASYKKPRAVVFVDSLPKLASGKVNKVELRNSYAM